VLCAGVPSAVPCAGSVPNPAYHRENPNWAAPRHIYRSRSWFDSLQVVLNKRLSRGLQLQGAYTWGKALDTTSGQQLGSDCSATGATSGVDPLNPENDKGPSCFDVKQSLHLNFLYHFPNPSFKGIGGELLKGWWSETRDSAEWVCIYTSAQYQSF